MASYPGGIHEELTEGYGQFYEIERIASKEMFSRVIQAWLGFTSSGGDPTKVLGIYRSVTESNQGPEDNYWVVYSSEQQPELFSLYGWLLSPSPDGRPKLPGAFKTPLDIVRKYPNFTFQLLVGPDDSYVAPSQWRKVDSPVIAPSPVPIVPTPSPAPAPVIAPSPVPVPVVETPPVVVPAPVPIVEAPPVVVPAPALVPVVVPSLSQSIPSVSPVQPALNTYYESDSEAATGFLSDDSLQDDFQVSVTNTENYEKYSIGHVPVVVGRSKNSSQVVVSSDPSVSRRHCTLQVINNQLVVVDLESANGTFIGPVRIPSGTPTVCPPRSTIRLGRVPLLVEAYE